MHHTQVAEVPPGVPARYGPAFVGLGWRQIPGGFSGAQVWRGEGAGGAPAVALKRWPPGFTAARLEPIHRWMKQAADLPFVPILLPTESSETRVYHNGFLWDATTWRPGSPLVSAQESEVATACAAVARLHARWPRMSQRAPSPGIRWRLDVLSQWLESPETDRPGDTSGPCDLLQRAAAAVSRMAPETLGNLSRWEAIPLLQQPCLRDLRGDHVLFSGTSVSGIVDYGAMSVDTPILDLARLLGDLAGRDRSLFERGLTSYRSQAPDLDISTDLVIALDRAGVAGSIILWLRRFRAGEIPVPIAQFIERLGELVRRAEN